MCLVLWALRNIASLRYAAKFHLATLTEGHDEHGLPHTGAEHPPLRGELQAQGGDPAEHPGPARAGLQALREHGHLGLLSRARGSRRGMIR